MRNWPKPQSKRFVNLEAIYFISQVIAAAALVASLIFVGLQVRAGMAQSRHAEQTARAQVHQEIAESYRQMALEWVRYPEMYKFMIMGAETKDMTDQQRQVFGGLYFPTMQMGENIYYQHRNGLLDDDQYETYLGHLSRLLKSPAANDWWQDRKFAFNPEYVAWIDAKLGSLSDFEPVGFYGEIESPDAPTPDTKLDASEDD